MKISTVINTLNEEKNIERCLASVKDFSGEIILVDMHSEDKTVEIAKKYGAKIFFHEQTRFVEPARNFALAKATGDWILLIDADEQLPVSLKNELKEVANNPEVDYVKIPRKNIIFGKWICHSRWWPDYLIRFFRQGKVKFSDKIHLPPQAEGNELILADKEENAIVHYNFQSISQFINRLNRYSDIQSEQLLKDKYDFKIEDLVGKPAGEFFSRFFQGEGYKDGLHGFSLGLLQAFSELAVYLKVWEAQGFKEERIEGLGEITKRTMNDFFYWQSKISSNFLKKIRLKIKRRI